LKALKVELGTSLPENVAQLLGKDPQKTAGKVIGDAVLCLLAPGIRRISNAQDRSEQVQRNLLVAFALAAYHREHGRYPVKLDDLAPRYLTTVPVDMFSGAALVYRPVEKGYLLYSVGINGKDEEGAGDDLAVRMPLPELKREK
jgi:hypothetical protein